MSELPPKTCEISSLVRSPRLVAASVAGEKTQQRRDGVYGYPGEEFTLEGIGFIMTALERQRLGDMTEADARAEGYPGLAAYREIILRMHAGMEWNPEALVWVHHYRKVGAPGSGA